MTKLTHTLNRLFTAGAAMALAAGLMTPAQAVSASDRETLLQDALALSDRTVTVGLATTASGDAESLFQAMMALEMDLQFPAVNFSSASSETGEYSTYGLVALAMTTRNTMLLRACTIAEDAAPPANLRAALARSSLVQRANTIQSALRLEAPEYRPGRRDLRHDVIRQANVEAEGIMAMLGDYHQMDTSIDMSSWYVHQLLRIMWQNAKDACDLYSE